MGNTSINVLSLLERQRDFFATHQTKSIKYRIENLKKLKAAIHKYEKRMADALWASGAWAGTASLKRETATAGLTEANRPVLHHPGAIWLAPFGTEPLGKKPRESGPRDRVSGRRSVLSGGRPGQSARADVRVLDTLGRAGMWYAPHWSSSASVCGREGVH